MHRLWCLVVIGALAVAVSVVGAGPAFAAKGGNNDTAHACQQGGHENRFEAETGRPFKNAGDCASHGAQGGDTSSLAVFVLGTYGCERDPRATCWGAIEGSGLATDVPVTINVSPSGATFTVPVGFDGTVNANLNLDCSVVNQSVNASAQTASGAPITASATSPCPL